MGNRSVEQKRDRGKILTEMALVRLESATASRWSELHPEGRDDWRGEGVARITQERKAELWGVDPRTVRRILKREERIDVETLRLVFERVGSRLNRQNDLCVDHLQVPDSLPVYATRLVGRESEIDELCRQLRSDAPRLVTLIGIGGMGKTRLAVEIARNLASDFLHAVWFMPLDSTDGRGSMLASVMMRRLGLSPHLSGRPLEALTAFLNHIGGPGLLVLDNFEGSVEYGTALVETLVRDVPTLRVLITSRLQPPGLTSQHVHRVRSLSVPGRSVRNRPVAVAAARSIPALRVSPAVRLFTERAKAARPDLKFGQDSAAAIMALCERVDGVPLAIELIAAWMKSMDSLEEIQARLRGEGLAAMRAVQDGTYDLLAEPLQTIFRRLSIFRDGWTAEAAAAVCHLEQIQGELDELNAWSLIFDEEVQPDGSRRRLRMLDSLREYAAEKLSEQERDEGGNRHLAFFLQLAEAAAEKLSGPDQNRWLDRLEAEHGNLCEAIEYSLAATSAGLEALRLVSGLCDYFRARGYVHEGSEYVRKALAHSEAHRTTRPWGDALHAAGVLAVEKGEYDRARDWFEESIRVRRALGDRIGLAAALFGLGMTFKMQSELSRARSYYRQSLLLLRAEVDATISVDVSSRARAIMAKVLHSLGRIRERNSNLRSAYVLYRRCFTLNHEAGNLLGIADALLNLGNNFADRGDLASAERYYLDCRTQYEISGNRRRLAEVQNNLGLLAVETGDHEKARPCFEESIRLKREVGDVRGEANSWCNLGNLELRQAGFEAAHASLTKSLVLCSRIEAKDGVIDALSGFAALAHAEQDWGRAAALFAACAVQRRQKGIGQLARDQEEQARTRHELEVALGDDYVIMATKGSQLSLDQAIEFAINGRSNPDQGVSLA